MSFWREINAADPVDTRSAYDKLNDEKGELQAKYEAVVAELEAAQGEIDAAKKRISELEKENGALQIAFDSCLKEDDARRIESDAIRKIEELVLDGDIKVSYGDAGTEWRDAGIWMLAQADKIERGEL